MCEESSSELSKNVTCLFNEKFIPEPEPDPDLKKRWNLDLYKTDPTPMFTILVKNSFLINLMVMISNMKIVFFKFQSKKIQLRQFLSQI